MESLKLPEPLKEDLGRVMVRIGITAGVGVPLLEAVGAMGLGPGGPPLVLVEALAMGLDRAPGLGLEAGMVMGQAQVAVLMAAVAASAEEAVATTDSRDKTAMNN